MGQPTESQGPQETKEIPLVSIFQHNLWANLRLLDACADLNEQQLAATLNGTYGNIYDTLVHILRAEQGYWLRIVDRRSESIPWHEDMPSVAEMRPHAQYIGEGLIAVVSGDDVNNVLEMEWDGRRRQIPASLFLAQALNHSNEHRAQVMTIMTQQGVEPPDLSGWGYMDERLPSVPVE